MRKKFVSFIALLSLFALAGCGENSSSLVTSISSESTSTVSTSTNEENSSVAEGFPDNPNLDESAREYYEIIDFSIDDVSTLKTDLGALINDHYDVGYDGLKEVFESSDVKPDGTVWDIYSDTSYNFSEGYQNYKVEGDSFNREHTVPQSWFDKKSPMRSDAFHVYPADGKVNGLRSNYEFGNIANPDSAKYTSTNGCMLGIDYRGTTVFEVCDEYKGDIARSYFYMATCYEDVAGNWGTSFSNSNYTKLSDYCLNVMLEWATNDPVSQKEIDRNDAIYEYQGNRNPYIDFPGLDLYIFS